MQSCLQSAGYSIGVQVINRGLTFVLNAVTLNYSESSALLGIINVRLALLYTTHQFLSREPFRRGCLGTAVSKKWPSVVNTIWLGFVLALALSYPLIYMWQFNSPSVKDLTGTNLNDYHTAEMIMCLVVLVEMMGESCHIYAKAKAISEHNPAVEIVFTLLKCILTALVTVFASKQPYILSKIVSCQLLAALISVIYSFYRLCNIERVSLTKFLPKFTEKLDEESLSLSVSFFGQTALKQLLTEGERYVMTFFSVISLSDQGIYDVVNNLGSLAARLIFKPIEDSAYTLFSQTVSRTEILDIRKFYRVQANLIFLVKAMLLTSLIVFTFGYNFVPLIVVYGGDKLNNLTAFGLMRWQLIYTPLLAINGITECFSFAIMNKSELHSHYVLLITSSIVMLATIYLTSNIFGSICFILANCLTMILRIIFSYHLIKRYFHKHQYRLNLNEISPTLTTLISLSGVFMVLSLCQHYLLDLNYPILVIFGMMIGAWSLLFMVLVILRHEEALIDFVAGLFRSKSL